MQSPVLVLNQQTKRDTGRDAQLSNIQATKATASIIRTTLGPQSMLKMILDPMGTIVITNDGNAILREVDVTHPAAKSMIELARTQDEEVGDGTTSVIVLAGEMMSICEPFLKQGIHPTQIVRGLRRCMDDAVAVIPTLARQLRAEDRGDMLKVIQSVIGTKFGARFGDLMCKLAWESVKMVAIDRGQGKWDIDTKRYVRVEKLIGGEVEESKVLDGIVLEKDILHPKMRRHIDHPRIVLLDCGLEFEKLESNHDVLIGKEDDFEKLLKKEEDYVRDMLKPIIALKVDMVVTEKGISDYAQHILVQHNITALRRLRKTDNNRLARAVGATIVHQPEDLTEKDVGTGCGVYHVSQYGNDYYSFFTECKDPKACSIILRGGSREVLNELDRNLQDAIAVARSLKQNQLVVPGGGAVEMALSQLLLEHAKSLSGVEQWVYRAAAQAFEVIPRTLLDNCGAQTMRVLTALRAKHSQAGNSRWGIDGLKGELADMNVLGVWDPLSVKLQSIKTAFESAQMLIRIDDIVSGISNKDKKGQQGAQGDEDGGDQKRQQTEPS